MLLFECFFLGYSHTSGFSCHSVAGNSENMNCMEFQAWIWLTASVLLLEGGVEAASFFDIGLSILLGGFHAEKWPYECVFPLCSLWLHPAFDLKKKFNLALKLKFSFMWYVPYYKMNPVLSFVYMQYFLEKVINLD